MAARDRLGLPILMTLGLGYRPTGYNAYEILCFSNGIHLYRRGR